MINFSFKQFMENAQGKKRLAIFDFDDTLVFTPTPEQGKPAYQAASGQEWPHKGWWGRLESLTDPRIFQATEDKLNHEVAAAFKGFRNDPETYVVVMTGRIMKFKEIVMNILSKYHIHADEYFFKTGNGDTFDYKANTIKRLVTPTMESVEIFDDREEHIPRFVALGKNLRESFPNLKTVVIHDVKQNKNYNL